MAGAEGRARTALSDRAHGHLHPHRPPGAHRSTGHWYEGRSSGLGQLFLEAVDAAVDRIIANPAQFPVIYRNIRRTLLRRFPYSLMFVIEADDNITVLACFHGSRDPIQWQRRM